MNSLMNFAFNVFWQTAAISVLGFVFLKIFSRWSAPTRSILASGLFIALVILPLLTCFFMLTNMNWLKHKSPAAIIFTYHTNDVQKKQAAETLVVRNLIMDESLQAGKTKLPGKSFYAISNQTISTAITVGACIWSAGIIFMLGQLLYGLIFLRGFRFGLSQVGDGKISRAMETALTVFDVSRLPDVYISAKVESPITIGIFNPIMILPESIYYNLNENEIKSILLHEFSHIYHYDHLIGLVKRIVIATNWWNPLVYIISAEHSKDREEVSDNYVLSQLSPIIYSECLVGLAEKTCLISSLPATVGMSDKHISLEQRIKNILSKKRNREMKTRKNVKGAICTLTCVAAVFIGGVQYTFADNPPATEAMDSTTFYKLSRKGMKLSPGIAEKLEKKVSENPDDLNSVTELLGYYFMKRFKNKDIREKREKIILQLIQNHPESKVLEFPQGQLIRHIDDSESAVKLWKVQVEKQPENLKILWNASCNLFLVDRKLAEKYLKKGQSLEPQNPAWANKLGLLYSLPGNQNPQDALKQYKKAYNETKAKNSNVMLPQLAKAALSAGKLEEAEKYANEMLVQAKELGKKNWNYGNLLYFGNFTLGMIAFKKGKIEDACKYLLESGNTPGSPQLNSFGPNMTLAKGLLEKGKKECVIKFLESCSKFWKTKKITGNDKCGDWIKQIQSGATPDFQGQLFY